MKYNVDLWENPLIDDYNTIPKGDMPGDKIEINEIHEEKASVIFNELKTLMSKMEQEKIIIAVHGGSGVGKSEIASLIAYYLNHNKIGAYVMSGDNYPHRMPAPNDAERLRVFREYAIKGLVKQGEYTAERRHVIETFKNNELDCDKTKCIQYPWLEVYQNQGRAFLKKYLGTTNEIDFDEVNNIIQKFKKGQESIYLKRMGRSEDELWYEEIDFSDKKVLVIEWTHGNNDLIQGVDIPILLNSTPSETLAHRKSRNRDGNLDSPFTMMVLELEQEKLVKQAVRAKIIITKQGELLSYKEYKIRLSITD